MKEQLKKTPLTPVQQESFNRILMKCSDQYEDKPNLNKVVDDIFVDTKIMYSEAMKKSLVQSILIPPDVKGLENEFREKTIVKNG
jgi:hypothetical protein